MPLHYNEAVSFDPPFNAERLRMEFPAAMDEALAIVATKRVAFTERMHNQLLQLYLRVDSPQMLSAFRDAVDRDLRGDTDRSHRRPCAVRARRRLMS